MTFHMQSTVPGWLDAVAKLPAGVPVKAVNDYFMCRDIKARNPNVKTVFRHVYAPQQPSGNYDENLALARHFFSTFIDGTWFQQEIYKYVDYIEEWNEYLANTTAGDELAIWLSWNKAVQVAWNEQKAAHPEMAHIKLVCCNTAVGNSIPLEFARQVASYGNVLGYHGYTHFDVYSLIGKLLNSRAASFIVDRSERLSTAAASAGTRDPLDWQYHSGRWVGMDANYVANGVYVKWLFTESGPYRDTYAGWKNNLVLGGDFTRYLDECVKYQIDHIAAWNEAHGHRALGFALFTTSNDSQWSQYNLDNSQLNQIADTMATYAPAPIDPDPPPPDPEPDCQGLPRVQYKRRYLVARQDVDLATWLKICEAAYANRNTVGFSHDDAGIGALDDKTAVVYGEGDKTAVFTDWYAENYPGTKVEFKDDP